MKWTCSVCGYTYEGPEPPAKCPQCGVPADKFVEVKEGEIEFVDEHVVGVAQGVDPEIIQGLRGQLQWRMLRSWYVPGNGKSCSQRRISGNRTLLGKGCLGRGRARS